MLNSTKIIVLAASLAAVTAQAAERVVDRVIAIIDQDIVTLRELEAKANPFMEQLATISDPEDKAKKRKEILRQVLDIEIGDKLVGKELDANRERLGVTDKEVDGAVEQVLRMNNLSREQLQAALYGQGVTWSEYRKKLRAQMERARLIQFKVQGRVQISEGEVKRRCLDRKNLGGAGGLKVCAAHILIGIPDGKSAEDIEMLRARASKMQSELSAGADFAAYALEHSDDKSAPDGNLGCFSRGEMVEAFEKVAFETPVGQVSPVVRTEFGFHVIKIKEKRAAATPCNTPESLEPFQNEIYQERLEQQMNVWIDELRNKAFVEVRL